MREQIAELLAAGVSAFSLEIAVGVLGSGSCNHLADGQGRYSGPISGESYWFAGRERNNALVVGVLVISHWILDWITHRPRSRDLAILEQRRRKLLSLQELVERDLDLA